MAKTSMLARGTKCIVRDTTCLYVNEINKDGTLGREYKLNTGVLFTIKLFDFYREGIIASDDATGEEFFIPVTENLGTVYVSKTKSDVIVDSLLVLDLNDRYIKDLILKHSLIGLCLSLAAMLVGILVGVSIC